MSVVEKKIPWSAPKIFTIVIQETNGKPRVRLYEGGDRPNNICQPGNPAYNPNLPRCFNRGPS